MAASLKDPHPAWSVYREVCSARNKNQWRRYEKIKSSAE